LRRWSSCTKCSSDVNKLKGVNLATLTDEELRSKLLQVNGLGPWSVDMFMLFDLHRPNVLPMGDLVVRKGVASFWACPRNTSITRRI
jgi:3-methyladenine DNA glycosylase/8-oxoguanine DNA glycosylase